MLIKDDIVDPNITTILSGTNKRTLLVRPPDNLPFDLVVDQTRGGFFWTEPNSGNVMFAGLDGTGITVVAAGLSFPSG